MYNVQLIFGNQYLEKSPAENLTEKDSQAVSPASQQNDPCCSAVKRPNCCESNK